MKIINKKRFIVKIKTLTILSEKGWLISDYSKVFKIYQLGLNQQSASKILERCDEVALRRLLASTELVSVIGSRIPSWKRKELALLYDVKILIFHKPYLIVGSRISSESRCSSRIEMIS